MFIDIFLCRELVVQTTAKYLWKITVRIHDFDRKDVKGIMFVHVQLCRVARNAVNVTQHLVTLTSGNLTIKPAQGDSCLVLHGSSELANMKTFELAGLGSPDLELEVIGSCL